MFKTQKENISDLLNLIKQYPDLPVLPLLGPEVYADCDCSEGFTVGSWGRCFIDEYLFIPESYIVFLKSDNKVHNLLETYFFWEDYQKLLKENADCNQIYNAMPWKKAIMVYVDPPEDQNLSDD